MFPCVGTWLLLHKLTTTFRPVPQTGVIREDSEFLCSSEDAYSGLMSDQVVEDVGRCQSDHLVNLPSHLHDSGSATST